MKHLFPCPCCGFHTLSDSPSGTFEICSVCYWEDDNVQYNDPNYKGGANKESLNEARKNFIVFKASSKKFLQSIRNPLPE